MDPELPSCPAVAVKLLGGPAVDLAARLDALPGGGLLEAAAHADAALVGGGGGGAGGGSAPKGEPVVVLFRGVRKSAPRGIVEARYLQQPGTIIALNPEGPRATRLRLAASEWLKNFTVAK